MNEVTHDGIVLVPQEFKLQHPRIEIKKGSKGWRRLRLACETLKVVP